MSIRKELLQSHIKELKDRWEQLSQKLKAISKQRDLETRADEKMRMNAVISETETERNQVEAELTKRQLELDSLTAPTAPAASSTPSAQHVIKPIAELLTCAF
jgi:chromosome segregation ATPase